MQIMIRDKLLRIAFIDKKKDSSNIYRSYVAILRFFYIRGKCSISSKIMDLKHKNLGFNIGQAPGPITFKATDETDFQYPPHYNPNNLLH